VNSGYSILAVDDDPVTLAMLSALVEQQGYAVTTAVEGAEALKVLAGQRVDAVLLDILMPGVDGIAVLETIKHDTRLCQLPVIMISAHEDSASIVRCIAMGAEDYLVKPFEPAMLRARIRGCLARKRFSDLQGEHHRIVREQAAELAELNRDLTRRVQALERLVARAQP
jgi:DNA-binding response OmpR family regulator